MEIRDIYDKYRRKTGVVRERGDNMEEGEHHIAVHVWIVSSKGEILIQKRQLDKKGTDKKLWGGMWDCSAGGCAVSGDDSVDTAIKETKEEIGLNIKGSDLEPLFTVKFDRGFDDNWLVRKDVDLENLILQKEEVTDIKWANIDEIYKMISKDEFIQFPFLNRLCQIINSEIRILQGSIEDYKSNLLTLGIKEIIRESKEEEYYNIIVKDNLIGSVCVLNNSPGIIKFNIINTIEGERYKEITEEVIKRIESLYPEGEKWEIETVIRDMRNSLIYKEMGYEQRGKEKNIMDKLILINYKKDGNFYRIKDIKKA